MVPSLPSSLSIVVLFLAVGLAGCLGEDEIQAAGAFRVEVRTLYDAATRPAPQDEELAAEHAALDLPSGTPARKMVFQVIVRPVDGHDYIGWEGDASCKPGFVNHGTGERRETDCGATEGKAEIVVPPPPADGSVGRHRYDLDANGTRVLVFPQPVLVAFRMLALYSDPLLEARADPSGCADLRSYARGAHAEATGGVRADGSYLRATGDGTVAVPFYGFCETSD